MASPFYRKTLKSELLLFFDFEATQFTHKAISLGILGIEKKPGTLFGEAKEAFLYQRLYHPADPIGPIVEKLTGLKEGILKEKGIPFSQSIKEIEDLLRPYHDKAFYSYGKEDILILLSSLDRTKKNEQEFFLHVSKNYLNAEDYLSHFLCGEKGNTLSVKKLMELYALAPEGKYHDSLTDAKALYQILRAFYQKPDRTLSLVKECYPNLRHIPKLDKRLALAFIRKEDVSFEEILKEEL